MFLRVILFISPVEAYFLLAAMQFHITNTAPPAKSKMAARGPQMGDEVWKGIYPRFLGILSNFR